MKDNVSVLKMILGSSRGSIAAYCAHAEARIARIDTPWVVWGGPFDTWHIEHPHVLEMLLQHRCQDVDVVEIEQKSKDNPAGRATVGRPVLWRTKTLQKLLSQNPPVIPSLQFLTYDLAAHIPLEAHARISQAESGLNHNRAQPLVPTDEAHALILPLLSTQINANPVTADIKVSVITCAYNRGADISWCIRSVMAQSADNWEMLIVDDGSTDQTPDWLRGVAHPRIRILRNEQNLGKARALNRGLAAANGDYVLELDADDWLTPHAVQALSQAMDERDHRVGMLTGQHHLWYRDRRRDLYYRGLFGGGQYWKFDRKEALPPIPRFYRANALRAVGGWPTDDLSSGRLFEDIAICTNLLKKYQIDTLETPLYHRVIHAQSISQQNTDKYPHWATRWFAD
ncbi:glycosyltransferase family 2 protein [Alicyclobacillus fodiniaquatilis]|uniref:Glycosyltransferase family 2 protein n=1 Tax=Alicyclobacillus fodiniaquatilis TaxID=1661150 RepID=A0ABW4JKY3_9BACL